MNKMEPPEGLRDGDDPNEYLYRKMNADLIQKFKAMQDQFADQKEKDREEKEKDGNLFEGMTWPIWPRLGRVDPDISIFW